MCVYECLYVTVVCESMLLCAYGDRWIIAASYVCNQVLTVFNDQHQTGIKIG